MRTVLPFLTAAFIGVGAAALEAAPIPVGAGAFGAGATLVTFDEVPLGTPGDGLTIGTMTFDWTGTGTVFVSNGGPVNTNNVTQPLLLSDTSAGALTVLLANPVHLFGYGYAVLAQGTVANATTMALYSDATFLGSVVFTGNDDPTFTGGFAGVASDDAFNRVVLTFAGAAFAIDNVRTDVSAVPEPTTLLLVGCGLAGVIARRRRAAGAPE